MQRADLETFYTHQADEVAAALAVFRSRDRGDFMRHWDTILAKPDVWIRTIILSDVPLGYVAAFRRDDDWLVAYWLGREHWGKGICTRALSEFLAEFPHRPLLGLVAASNQPSLRVLEKCGFVEQGRERDDDGSEEVLLQFG